MSPSQGPQVTPLRFGSWLALYLQICFHDWLDDPQRQLSGLAKMIPRRLEIFYQLGNRLTVPLLAKKLDGCVLMTYGSTQ